MRLATVINLLLCASAACALQLRHDERPGGSRSSAIRHRSFRPISRRRLTSRAIGFSMNPGIVPRGSDSELESESESLPLSWTTVKVYAAWKRPIKKSLVAEPRYGCKVFKVTLGIDEKYIRLFVKEYQPDTHLSSLSSHSGLTLGLLRHEVRDMRDADRRYGAISDEKTSLLLLKEKKEETATHTEVAALKSRHYCGITGWDADDLPILDH